MVTNWKQPIIQMMAKSKIISVLQNLAVEVRVQVQPRLILDLVIHSADFLSMSPAGTFSTLIFSHVFKSELGSHKKLCTSRSVRVHEEIDMIVMYLWIKLKELVYLRESIVNYYISPESP